MFKNLASICAALIIAAAAFSTPAQAQRHHGGGAHFSGARTGAYRGVGIAPRGYAYRGSYSGRHYGGGWGYYGGGLAAEAIIGGLLAAAPYYGGGYYDGYGYGDYAYEAPVYVERGGVNCSAISPGSPDFGACN